ncbi:glycosyltransferase family 2 protein [Clostridium perfringens]
MNISLVILNYNSYKLTIKLAEKCEKYNIINQIIIVDNASTDVSLQYLEKIESKKIILIKNSKNSGYASGNNLGIKYAIKNFKSDFIIISNPDVYFKEESIKKCIEILQKNKINALIAPRIENLNCSGEVAWKLPMYKNDLLSLFYISNILNKKMEIYDIKEKNKEILEVDVLPGSLLVIKSNVIKDINYLDENTFLYCEERILGYKLKEKGYKTILLNSDTYIHEHGATIKKEIKSKINQYKILNKSKRYYLKKYLNKNKFELKIFDFLCEISYIEKKILYFLKNRRS